MVGMSTSLKHQFVSQFFKNITIFAGMLACPNKLHVKTLKFFFELQ